MSSSQSRPPTSAHRAPTSRGQRRPGAVAQSGTIVPRSSHQGGANSNASNFKTIRDEPEVSSPGNHPEPAVGLDSSTTLSAQWEDVGSHRPEPTSVPASPAPSTTTGLLDREDVDSSSLNFSPEELGILPFDSTHGPWNRVQSQASSLDGALGHLQSFGQRLPTVRNPTQGAPRAIDFSINAPTLSASSSVSSMGQGAEVLEDTVHGTTPEDLEGVPWASATAESHESSILASYFRMFGCYPTGSELNRLVNAANQGALAVSQAELVIDSGLNTSSAAEPVTERRSFDTDDSGGAVYHTPPTTSLDQAFDMDNVEDIHKTPMIDSPPNPGIPLAKSRIDSRKLDKHASTIGVFSGSPTRPYHSDDEDDHYHAITHISPTPSFAQTLNRNVFGSHDLVGGGPSDIYSKLRSRFSDDTDDARPAPPQLAASPIPFVSVSETSPASATRSGSVTPLPTARAMAPSNTAGPSTSKVSWSKLALQFKKDKSKAKGKEKEGREKEGREKEGRERGDKEKGGKENERERHRQAVNRYLEDAQPADIDKLLLPPPLGHGSRLPGRLRHSKSETYFGTSWELLQDHSLPPRTEEDPSPAPLPSQSRDVDARDGTPLAVDINHPLLKPTSWDDAAFIDAFLATSSQSPQAVVAGCACPLLDQTRVCACPSSATVYVQHRSPEEARTRRQLLVGHIIGHIQMLMGITTDTSST
ncbi:hypothetical protein FA13DRAFT_1710453 [Coprinellus micaceus]|uniref:Uncharacterized protein n=1 Tax=Coprinellus micaceus TaxID=71717 RepID=A0A4Y7T8X9_COPMI|nr:hypothetical protein FA13DRAFT_1710453 [Coprinellus micaceus]